MTRTLSALTGRFFDAANPLVIVNPIKTDAAAARIRLPSQLTSIEAIFARTPPRQVPC
jgi:hypothetical protein